MRGVVLSNLFGDRLRAAPPDIQDSVRDQLAILLRDEHDPALHICDRPFGPRVREARINGNWLMYYRSDGDMYVLLTLYRAVGLDMLVDRVDANDHVIDVIPRKDVFARKLSFRVVHVFVFNQRGDLLTQRLSQLRQRYPLRLGSSVAGYLFAGESYEAAASRRLGQELGVAPTALDLIGKTPMNDAGVTKFITLYTVRHDGPFSIDTAQAAATQFVPMRQLLELASHQPEALTPSFLHLLNFYSHRGAPPP